MAGELNWFERSIAAVAPGWAASRMESKLRVTQLSAAMALTRKYEAATTGRRGDGWVSASTSANAEIGDSLERLRNRHRQLVRDNPYASRAVSGIANNMVGAGIMATPNTTKTRLRKAYLDAWRGWAETTACDADGRHNLYGLQLLAARTVIEAGEVLIRRRVRRPGDGLQVPLQIQVLEPDYIDLTRNGPEGSNTIVQGVEFDPIGRRVAYWLYDQHPGDANGLLFLRGNNSRRIPAEDILHVFRMDRSGQVHGVPWGAPAMLRLRDFDEYEDAQLIRQKIAACFTAFVTDMEPTATGATRDSVTGELTRRMEPGLIQHLPLGKGIEFATPPVVTGYAEYAGEVLHAVAVGYGVPYELLTGNLRGVNFSSGRMGWMEFQRNIDAWRWNMFIPGMCDGVWSWFSQMAVIAGVVAERVPAEWTPPRREMIDPASETRTIRDQIRTGLMSWKDAVREQGRDPEQVLSEIAQTNAELDKAGVILDCDPRRVSGAGNQQMQPAGNAGGGNEADEGDDETDA